MNCQLCWIAVLLLFLYMDLCNARTGIKVNLVQFYVNGKDIDNKKCDYVIKTACDPEFLFCLDHRYGNSNPNDCTIRNTGWTKHYQGQNTVHFSSDLGNGISNPIGGSVDTWQGGFKFKSHVKDDDDGNDDDDIDTFDYVYTTTPARSESEANWDERTIIGRRSNGPTTLKLQFRVYCETNYFTKNCSVFCQAKPEDHFTCDPDTGGIVCKPGWETPEEDCNVKVNDCEVHDCVNGATCVDHYKSYTCKCMPGYTGTRCETEIDECQSNPCLNGGSCVDAIDFFTCKCTDQYAGDICEHHVCNITNYCENGGTCFDDGVGNVSCLCTPAYTGRHCDVDICDIIECMNGGTCNSGTCICPVGYIGALCDIYICDSCENGATCQNGMCVCPRGYTGTYCHININECESDPCLNEGTCRDGINGFTCRCLPGYNGTLCEVVLPPEVIGGSQGQTAVIAVSEERPNWVTAVIVSIVGLIIVIVLAVAIIVRYRKRHKKENHTPPTVISDSGLANFTNPLYSGMDTSNTGMQASVSTVSVPTSTEKGAFDSIGTDPPPYTQNAFHTDGEPTYAEAGAICKPPLPPDYTPRGAFAGVVDDLPYDNNSKSQEARCNGAVGGQIPTHYDNPQRLRNSPGSHYDSPQRMFVESEHGYATPRNPINTSTKKNLALPSENSDATNATSGSGGGRNRQENDYATLDAVRSVIAHSDQSVHNNNINENLERDNAGFNED